MIFSFKRSPVVGRVVDKAYWLFLTRFWYYDMERPDKIRGQHH